MPLATAVIPRTDLARLVESITPLRVTIDKERGRVITFGRPRLELVSGAGIRLRGSGLVSWDFAHVSIPVRVKAWQLLFVPRVTSRGGSHVLSLEPRLEELEVRSVPGLVDGKVAGAIRRAIAQNRLAWNFARTLSKRLPLPARVSPTSTFSILPVGGDVSVNEREIQLVLQCEAQFAPELEPEVEAEPEVEPEPELERTAVAETKGETEGAREQASRAVHLPTRPPMGVDRRRLPRKRHAPIKSRTLRRPAPPRGGRVV